MRKKIQITLVLVSVFALVNCSFSPKKIAWNQTVKPQIAEQLQESGIESEEEIDQVNDGIFEYVVEGKSEGLEKVSIGLENADSDAREEIASNLESINDIISKIPGPSAQYSAKLKEVQEAITDEEEE